MGFFEIKANNGLIEGPGGGSANMNECKELDVGLLKVCSNCRRTYLCDT